MPDQLTAMLTVAGAWVVFGSTLIGVGLLVQRLFRVRALSGDRMFKAFWMGLTVLVGTAQVYHLFRPIDLAFGIGVYALGLTGLALNFRDVAAWLVPGLKRHAIAVIGLALLAVWTCGRALSTPDYIDSGIYHIPVVQWTLAYPIVPGLGNLLDRIAFNNANLLYVAAIDAALVPGHSHNVANSLLALSVVAYVALCASRLFPVGREKKQIAANVMPVVLLTPIIAWIASTNICSPSTDLPSGIALFVGFALLFRLLCGADHADGKWRGWGGYDVIVVVSVLTLAATFKISQAVPACFGCLLALRTVVYGAGWRGRLLSGTVACSVAIAAALLVPWMIRGVIVSGYPMYPSTIGAMPVDWRIPVEVADDQRRVIAVDAKLMRAICDLTAPEQYGFRWLPLWTRMQFSNVFLGITILPLAIAFGAAAFTIIVRVWKQPSSTLNGREWSALIPLVIGIAFWFFTAPSPRFGTGLFWMLAAVSTALCFGSCLAALPRRWFNLLAACMVAFAVAPTAAWAVLASMGRAQPVSLWTKPGRTPTGITKGFADVNTVELLTFRTRSGIELKVPRSGYQIWAAPIPATTMPTPRLRLRKPGDFSAGFRYDATPGNPPRAEAISAVVSYIAAHSQAGDVIYADDDAIDAITPEFMAGKLPGCRLVPPTQTTRLYADYQRELSLLRGNPRIWVVLADGPRGGSFDEQAGLTDKFPWMGVMLDSRHEPGVSVYLCDILYDKRKQPLAEQYRRPPESPGLVATSAIDAPAPKK